MFNFKDRIFKAPPVSTNDTYNKSLGEFIYEKIDKLPKDTKTHLNAETGEFITVTQLLNKICNIVEDFKAIGLKNDAVVTLVGSYGQNQIPLVFGTIFYGASLFPVEPTMKALEYEHIFTIQVPDIVFAEKSALNEVRQALKNRNLNPDLYIVDSNEKIEECKSYNDFARSATISKGIPKSCDNSTKRLALIMPSSGTTGKPKGVGWTHGNIINSIIIFQAECKFNTTFTYLSITQLFWASGALSLLTYLCQGATFLYIRSTTPEVILSAIQNHKPDFTIFIPSTLASVLMHPNFSKFDLSSLKLILTGGAPISMTFVELMQKKWKTFNKLKLAQLYGATEITGVVTASTSNGISAPIKSVGYLANGFEAKVVNSNGKPLFPKEIGEILLKNENTQTFYVNNTEGTAQAYDEEKFYKTGDLGYITEDGLLYITGRLKDLIKTKGYQISPVEVEEVILSIPGVKDVAVIGIPDTTDGYLTSAVVVKSLGSCVTQQDIVNEVAEKLSEPKHLRGGVKFVSRIPYNTNGKKLRNQVLNFLDEILVK